MFLYEKKYIKCYFGLMFIEICKISNFWYIDIYNLEFGFKFVKVEM